MYMHHRCLVHINRPLRPCKRCEGRYWRYRQLTTVFDVYEERSVLLLAGICVAFLITPYCAQMLHMLLGALHLSDVHIARVFYAKLPPMYAQNIPISLVVFLIAVVGDCVAYIYYYIPRTRARMRKARALKCNYVRASGFARERVTSAELMSTEYA